MSVENQANASYTEYQVQVEHTRYEGISASPIAGPHPQNVSFTRLYAPIEFLQFFWTATRDGAAPVLPSHKSFIGTNSNRVFLGGARTGVVTPTFGGHVYSVSGVYVYALSETENLDSGFALSMCPWETPSNTQGMNLIDFSVPAANFATGIINPYLLTPLDLPVDPDVPLLQNPLQG